MFITLFNNFHQIIRFLTEPFFICAFCGYVLLWRQCRWNKGVLDSKNLILIIFTFGVLWRCFSPKALVSIRYAEFLILPGSLLCCCLFTWFMKKNIRFGGLKISGFFVVSITLVALVIWSGVKLLRIKGSPAKDIGIFLKNKCQKSSGIVVCNSEKKRIEYYSGLKSEQFKINSHASSREKIKLLNEKKRYFYYCADNVFFVLISNHRDEFFVNEIKASPDFEILKQQIATKGVHKHILVLRVKKHDIVKEKFEMINIPNGDFHLEYAPEACKKQREDLVRRGMSFFQDHGIRLPQNWRIYSKNPEAKAFLTEVNHKKVLDLSSPISITAIYQKPLPFIEKLKYLSFSAKGSPDTYIIVKITPETKPATPPISIAKINLTPNFKTYVIPLDECGVTVNGKFSFEITIRQGNAIVQNFVLLGEKIKQ